LKFELKKFSNEIAFDAIPPLFDAGSAYISSVLEDNNRILWVSTYDKGVYCLKNNKIINHFDVKDAKEVIQDNENNIWISSMKDGVYKISPYFDNQLHLENSLFENSGILALCQNDNSGIWCTNGKTIYLLKNNELHKLQFNHSENSFNEILQINPLTLLVGETSKMPYILEGIRFNKTDNSISAGKVSLSNVILKNISRNNQKKEISSYNQFSLYFIDPYQLFRKIDRVEFKERIFNTYYNCENELVINARKNYIYQSDTFKISKTLSCFNDKIITEHLNLDEKSELINIEGDSLYILHNKSVYNLTAAFEQPIDLQIKHVVYHDSTIYFATSRNIYICKNPLNILRNRSIPLSQLNINFRSIHSILFNDNKLYIAVMMV